MGMDFFDLKSIKLMKYVYNNCIGNFFCLHVEQKKNVKKKNCLYIGLFYLITFRLENDFILDMCFTTVSNMHKCYICFIPYNLDCNDLDIQSKYIPISSIYFHSICFKKAKKWVRLQQLNFQLNKKKSNNLLNVSEKS